MPRAAVVFVHGIYSSCDTFRPLRDHLRHNKPSLERWICDYDFHERIHDSGNRLNEKLKQNFAPEDRVVIVAHSMGGLVGRMSVLLGGVTCVKRLIMLGTPNFGAVRTARMGLLAQSSALMTNRLHALFTRKQGILELSKVPEVFHDVIENGSQNARTVEYVTIPGLFFNEDRATLAVGKWGGRDTQTMLFAGLSVGIEVLESMLPLWKVPIERPHDGIVEESSNSLISDSSRAWTEKTSEITNPGKVSTPPGHTYAHIVDHVCLDLTHVMIQGNPRIIALVSDLISAKNLDDWYSAQPLGDMPSVRFSQ